MTDSGEGKALLEACIRLAWYTHKFGAIPDHDLAMLAKAVLGNMFGYRLPAEEHEIVELASEIRKHLLSTTPE